MRKAFKIIFSLIVISIVLSASSYLIYSNYHIQKNYQVSFSGNAYNYSVDPYNNSSGAMFMLNFTLADFSGGSIQFTPTVILNSSYSPDTYQENSTIFNLSNNSSYGIMFYPNAYIYPQDNTPGAGNYATYVYGGSSMSTGGPVIMWHNNGNWNIPFSSLHLAAGTYNISYRLMFNNTEPGHSALNVTNASSVVNLISFRVSATVNLHGTFSVQNLTVKEL